MRSSTISIVTFELKALTSLSLGDPLREDVSARIMRSVSHQEPTDDQSADDGDVVPIDIPVACRPTGDGRNGDPVIRGSSLIGPLRRWLARHELTSSGSSVTVSSIASRGDGETHTRPVTLADVLMGSDPEELDNSQKSKGPEQRDRALAPSAVRLVFAELSGTVNDGHTRVAINRATGAADASKLFRRTELLSDATISVIIEVDHHVLNARIASLSAGLSPTVFVNDFVHAVANWAPTLGGMTSHDYGRMEVTKLQTAVDVSLNYRDFLDATDTLSLYRGKAGKPHVTDLSSCQAPDDSEAWRLEVEFEAADPLFIAPTDEPEPDDDGQERKNIRASASEITSVSWRGVIRSRCEYILRSCGVEACEPFTAACVENTGKPCPTCYVFGWTPSASNPTLQGAQSLVAFETTEINQRQTIEYTHAPIDRFTGGVVTGGLDTAGKLYTNKSYAPGSRARLVVKHLPGRPEVPLWARSLIALAIRDVAEGYVGVGNSTTRGYGTLQLVTGHEVPPIDREWFNQLLRWSERVDV